MFSFGTSIHKDVTERLSEIRPDLAEQVHEVLLCNKRERHIRGGMATKRKYELLAKSRKSFQEETNRQILTNIAG